MHGSSANQGFPCNSAFWISFSPWQHKPALGHGCGLCSVHTRTHARTHARTLSILYTLYSDDHPLMSSNQSNLSESYRDINKTHMAGELTHTANCCIPTPVNVQSHVPKCYTLKNTREQKYDFIQHSQRRKCLDQYLQTHEKKHTVLLHSLVHLSVCLFK